MHFTENKKIDQVDESTLVVGMDIAKRVHYACFVDDRGRVLRKSFQVRQTREHFEALHDEILKAMETHQKSKVIVGIEPTGHYWLNLAYYLEERGIPLVMTNPMHVKRSKELDDNLPTKHDKKDALVIARLVKDGRYSYPRILKDMDAELRAGSSLRDSLVEDLGRIKNQMIRWLDRYFPEFTSVFPNFGKMALAALEWIPMPSDVIQLSADEIVFVLKQSEHLKSPQRPKAVKLIQAATDSIGVTHGLEMARIEIATLLRRYHRLNEEIAELDIQLKSYVTELEEYEILSTVPGLGDASIVELLSEIGSFKNYDSPRQLLKLAGLTLRENSSGQHKGQKRISKRGRRKLRKILFRVMLPMIMHNKAFRALHKHYTERTINPLKKKQSIVVLCGKLLKILHTLVVKGRYFSEETMMKDIPALSIA